MHYERVELAQVGGCINAKANGVQVHSRKHQHVGRGCLELRAQVVAAFVRHRKVERLIIVRTQKDTRLRRRIVEKQSGEVRFMITSARIDPPKKPMNVWINTVSTAKPMPKINCPVYVKGVVAGSVAMKNPKKIELPMNNSNMSLRAGSPL